jgi:hypothetical protein
MGKRRRELKGAEVERSEGAATEKNKNNNENIYARKE